MDQDGDGIADRHEGRSDNVDTDGDGTPDYKDEDSDGDGLADSLEAGDQKLETPPRDTDGDGTPDFRSQDSDNNGLPDSEEKLIDTDGDGWPDFADMDDDNDFMTDRRELNAVSGRIEVDFDEDGLPNFKDPDSDNDLILDGDEADGDLDEDGRQNWRDLDTDNDGIPDEVEAGDDDLYSRPVDSDNDGTQDFRDLDSDNDGLSDAAENRGDTDFRESDTDGDGVSDLIEVGAGTDARDPMDNPRTRGDFVFVVPHEQAPMPREDTLEFRTNIQFSDVYFLMDTTASMEGEIAAMRDAVEGIIDNMLCQQYDNSCMRDQDCRADQVCGPEGMCIENPTRSSCVASVWTGVGAYWGDSDSYTNLESLQGDPAITRGRIPGSADGGGGSEALFESVSCVVNPSLCQATGCDEDGLGCPGFREDAIKILVTITDEDDQCTRCSSDSASAAGMELAEKDVTFVGVDADVDHLPRADLESIATNSDSLGSMGDPLVFDGNESEVSQAVTSAINEIVDGVPLRATIEATDQPDDAGNALQFIKQLKTNTEGGVCTDVGTGTDTDGDGADDTFEQIVPGTPVCWDVVAARNDSVMPTDEPQVFKAKLTVKGDGSPLDSRDVFFLVPPTIGPSMLE